MTAEALISRINAVLWLLVLAGGAALGIAFSNRTGLELLIVGIAVPMLFIAGALLIRLLGWALETGLSSALLIYGKTQALLLVVLLGLLAAVAIPLYEEYQTRAKISESLAAMAPARRAVENHFAGARGFPGALSPTQLAPPAGGVLREVRYDASKGALVLVFGAEPIEGKSIALAPAITEFGALSWKCSTVSVPAKYLPDSCR